MLPVEHPLLSVCIPVYNCERFIGAAIESVLAQTRQDFELVILNNCSTDRTAEVIRRYDDPRIRLVENETNIGASGNWNKALAEARGRFIKIVCADDLLYPTCLERQLAILLKPENSGVVMVCCGRDVIDEQGKRLLKRHFKGGRGRLAGRRAIGMIARAGTNRIGEPTSVLFRADVLPRVGGFDSHVSYVLDVEFWCRLLLHGDLWVIPESLSAFRVSAGSWSVDVTSSQGRDFRRLLDKMAADRAFGLTSLDRGIGQAMALVNMQLRAFFYKVVLGTKGSRP